MKEKNDQLMKIAQAGLMAALCYIGYAVFPAISASGSKITSEMRSSSFPRTSSEVSTEVFPERSAYRSLILSAVTRHLHREPLSQSL